MDAINTARTRIQQIEEYITRNGYESFDPYDGLTSPIPRFFFGKWQMGLRVWQQAMRLSPLELRPLLGVRKIAHTKTISDFASAYALLYKISGSETYEQNARFLLDWLLRISAKTNAGYGWGLRFPYATRYVVADSETLNSYQTVNAIHALLDGYEFLRQDAYLRDAHQGLRFLEQYMGYRNLGERMSWVYWKSMETEVHNINGLMLGLLSRMFQFTGENRFKEFSLKLYKSLCLGQNQDGSWFYSQDERGRWLDGFHTGFILEGISRAILAGVLDFDEHYSKAVTFFKTHLFTRAGLPRYYPDKLYPIDVQNSAQAIQTHAFLARLGFSSVSELSATIQAIDGSLWNPKGYYNHLKNKWWVYKTPMHRWGTGPMFLALAYARGTSEGKL